MKELYLISILLLTTQLFCQEKEEENVRLNFIFMVDNEVSDFIISDGIIVVRDSIRNIVDTLNFNYDVGDINLRKDAYNKLLHSKDSKVSIKFKLKKYFLNIIV